jgi:hypothetical protein
MTVDTGSLGARRAVAAASSRVESHPGCLYLLARDVVDLSHDSDAPQTLRHSHANAAVAPAHEPLHDTET